MAKKAKKANADPRFIMAITPAHKAQMRAAAKKAGLTMSGYVRQRLGLK